MRQKSVLVLMLATILLSACSVGGLGGSSANGTPEPPANALKVTIAYSPEKKAWLTDRIAAFNNQRVKVNGQTVFVEGTDESSGVTRTKIKQGQTTLTAWSPSASTWLEVLRQETNNQNIAASSKPLVLTPVVIGM